LDARGRDIRGAPLRTYRSAPSGATAPFEPLPEEDLPGGGHMAGRVYVSPRCEGPTTIAEYSSQTGTQPRHVITLPSSPALAPLFVVATTAGERSRRLAFTRSADGATLCFSPAIPPRSRVVIGIRTADELEIVASSSAAWPPAGASGVWRGRLTRMNIQPQTDSPTTTTGVLQTG
jgi:hypothetical protein